MKIAVIGTGGVGRTLAAGLAASGHDVVVGTRDPDDTRRRPEWDQTLPLARSAEAVAGVEVVVNATNGQASLAALDGLDLAGKVLLDVANPLDFSAGFPPTLSVKDTDSLAEQLQRAHPDARVVKSLNTVNAAVMTAPGRLPAESTIFVAGDDADARGVVAGLLAGFGWTDIVEFEALDAARGLEMWLPLWVRLMGTLGTADFNLKLIR